jgi:hypothetical protein
MQIHDRRFAEELIMNTKGARAILVALLLASLVTAGESSPTQAKAKKEAAGNAAEETRFLSETGGHKALQTASKVEASSVTEKSGKKKKRHHMINLGIPFFSVGLF